MVAYVYKAVKQRHPVMDYYHVDLLAKSQKNIFQWWMEWNDCTVEILLQLFLSLIAQSTWSNLKKNLLMWHNGLKSMLIEQYLVHLESKQLCFYKKFLQI